MKRFIFSSAVLGLTLAWGSVSFAQGIQTGTIRGMVTDQQMLPVPGVSVTATSPALQGTRSTVTDTKGVYILSALPAGDYQIKFELSGFETETTNTSLPLGLTVVDDVTLRAGGVTAEVQVVAETPAPIATPVVGANITHEEVDTLPTLRTVDGIARLSPGISEATVNPTTLVINGAFSFDNIFMVNGVDINDNLFANPQNLFIEDAIQETQVLTSGISAEYGRFTGGVINAITKSGGNVFSGSFRTNFSSPSWTTATPFEVSAGAAATAHPSNVSESYEGTLGGPIVKDRLWFFAAGRYQSLDTTVTLAQTGIVLPSTDTNKRGEIKVTGSPAGGHTIQGGFLNDPRTRTNNSGIQPLLIDPHSEVNRSNPNWYYFANYHGVVGNNLLVEGQFSQRHFEFVGDGGSSATFGPAVTTADLIANSPIIASCFCAVYNAPFFDVSDPMHRNNFQVTGSATDYWEFHGRHETKAGYEWFRSQVIGGLSQSPTSYAFIADFLTDANGAPVLDSTGRPIPTFAPYADLVSFFPAERGATLNVDNHSLFVQDHWAINPRWSADLGARFEHVIAKSTGLANGDITSIDNSRIVPRLAVAWDLRGNGEHVIHFTYGQYSGRYDEAQIAPNSPVANPPEVDSIYVGPAGQGYNFAPGFDLSNYSVIAASDATQNVKVDPNLKSPLVHEFTVGYGTNLFMGKGYAEATYIGRKTVDLIEDYQTLAQGTTNVVVNGVSAGLFTNRYFTNAPTSDAFRQYQALVFQARYRFSNNWSINGNYTLELQNKGNYEGEATNQPAQVSPIGNFPEAFSPARNFPVGNLDTFQRSRLRIWSVYNWDLGRYGDLSVSGLWRVDSALVYSLVARNQQLTTTQQAILAAAGYPDQPSFIGNNVFFTGARGDQQFAGFGLFDMSLNYNVPVFRTLRPWVKFDVYNLFNNQKLIAWNTTISQNKAAGVDNLGLATSYTPGAAFGTATGNTVTNLYNANINAFPLAYSGAIPGGRTATLAVGFRF